MHDFKFISNALGWYVIDAMIHNTIINPHLVSFPFFFELDLEQAKVLFASDKSNNSERRSWSH